MNYKISKILHSGSFGERGQQRTDGRYPIRIGRTVKINMDDIEIGQQYVLEYISKTDGSDYTGYYLRLSPIMEVTYNSQYDELVIETVNSIYILEKIK